MWPSSNPSNAVYEQLHERVKKASFADGKLSELQLCLRGGNVAFTSKEGRELVHLIHGDKEQQEAARLLYRVTSDPWRFGEVLAAFTFKSSREAVIHSVLETPPLCYAPFGQPLSDADFMDLCGRLKQYCSFASDKLLEAKLLVHAKAFMLSQQVSEIISLIHGDKEQIEGAVLMYPLIVDPANFGVALSKMTFASSKKDVLEKVKNIPAFAGSAPSAPQYSPHMAHQPAYGYPPQQSFPPPQQHFSPQPYHPQGGFAPPQGYYPGYPQPGYYPQQPFPQQPYPQQPGYPQPQGVFMAQQPVPMSNEAFQQLQGRLRTGFASDKKDEVLLALRGGAFFSSEQARVLLDKISGDSEQKEAALALYPNVTDKQNFGHALSALKFNSTRQEVMQQLK